MGKIFGFLSKNYGGILVGLYFWSIYDLVSDYGEIKSGYTVDLKIIIAGAVIMALALYGLYNLSKR